jgi:predicted DsbA family dithiol-disulfide isomerase
MKPAVAVGCLVMLFGAVAAVPQPPESGYVGAAKPDVTILEYFDYNCPYCRKLAPVLRALLVQDRRVAVVYKEWPIFGGISVYAARSALAAHSGRESTSLLTMRYSVDRTSQGIKTWMRRWHESESTWLGYGEMKQGTPSTSKPPWSATTQKHAL